MSIIVEIVYSPPARNTCSQKWLHPNNPHDQHFEDGMVTLDTRCYFFTLPNTMDDDSYIHLVQWNTCMFDLQDLGHEELGEGKQDEENENRSGKSGMIKKRVEVSTQTK